MSITRNDIVEASINILNRDGITGLSMRSIAKELKIKAASLYFHISGKTELFSEIAEYLCIQCAKPEETLKARDYLIEAAKMYRAMLLTVRDSVEIFEDSTPSTPCRIGIIRSWTERLLKIGIGEKNLLTVANIINNYVLSFTEDELRKKRRTSEEIRATNKMLDFKNQAVSGKPKKAKVPGSKQASVDEHYFDEQFIFGLRLILAGIETAGS